MIVQHLDYTFLVLGSVDYYEFGTPEGESKARGFLSEFDPERRE